jgi:WD40 repeat protein
LVRFLHEAELIARIQHPHIVQIYKIGTHQGQPFLALEYVSGGNLEQHLGKPWQPRQAAAFVETLARAMAEVHACGIVHRDLKPANVLLQKSEVRSQRSEVRGPEPEGRSSDLCPLTSDLCPKITDFGLAKADLPPGSDAVTQPGELLGTPLYMAPEQARGQVEKIGPATDLHALGMILYEMLTGRPPFQAQNTFDMLTQVVFQEPVPPSRLVRGIPADLEAICLKCLAKKPEDRYASASELARDLRRFQEGFPVEARPVSMQERLGMWARRQPVIAALSLAVLLSLAGGMGMISWQWWRAESALAATDVARRDAEQAQQKAESAQQEAELAREKAEFAQWEEKRSREKAELAQKEEKRYRLKAERLQRNEAAARKQAEEKKAELARTLEESELLLTRSLVGLAAGNVAAHQFARAEALLDECPNWTRHWEWRHLQHHSRVRLLVLGLRKEEKQGAQGAAIPAAPPLAGMAGSVALSPDGQLLATASGPRGKAVQTVHVYEASTGNPVRTLPGGSPVAFSPDGKLLAVLGPQGGVRLWSTAPGLQLVRGLGENGPQVRLLAFSPDSRSLATVDTEKKIKVWPLANPGGPLTFASDFELPVRALTFSPDGKLLALAGRREVHFRDLEKRKPWTVAVNKKTDKPVRVQLPAPSGQMLPTRIQALAWIRPPEQAGQTVKKGILFIACDDGTIRGWDAKSGESKLTLPGHTSSITGLAQARGGQLLASVGDDGTVRLWDLTTKSERLQLPGVGAVAIDARGNKLLAPQRDRSVVLWGTGAPPKPAQHAWHKDGVLAVIFAPDGQTVISGGLDSAIRWHNVRTGAEPRPAFALRTLPKPLEVVSLAIHPKSRTLVAGLRARSATGPAEGELHVWNLQDNKERTLPNPARPVLALAYSRDGELLAGACADGSVYLWQGQTLEPIRTLNGPGTTRATGVAFSPGGETVYGAFHGGEAGMVRAWDAQTGAVRWSVRGTAGNLLGLAASADGKMLATGSRQGIITIWNARTGVEERVLIGHTGEVPSVAFSPNSLRLASASSDGTVRLWDPLRGWEMLTLRTHKQSVSCVAFNQPGRWLASASRDQTVGLFEAP